MTDACEKEIFSHAKNTEGDPQSSRSKSTIKNSSLTMIFLFYFTADHEAVKPVFVTEPSDRYVLPNSQAPLLCEAKFVSKLNFSCTEGLVPKEIYRHQKDHNVTTLIADVSHVIIKAASCVCLATGYSGLVLKSRSAAVTVACKSWLQFFYSLMT